MDICEICNHIGLRQNFEIRNIHTNHTFLIGSKCITRFIKLDGVETLEDSSVLFKIKSGELIAIKILQNLIAPILGIPTVQELGKFRRYARKLLGDNPQNVTKAKWQGFLVNIFSGRKPTNDEIDRIRMTLFNFRAIRTQKVKLSNVAEQERIGSWSSTGKVKTRVGSTLAQSEAYKNPQKITNK